METLFALFKTFPLINGMKFEIFHKLSASIEKCLTAVYQNVEKYK